MVLFFRTSTSKYVYYVNVRKCQPNVKSTVKKLLQRLKVSIIKFVPCKGNPLNRAASQPCIDTGLLFVRFPWLPLQKPMNASDKALVSVLRNRPRVVYNKCVVSSLVTKEIQEIKLDLHSVIPAKIICCKR